MAVGGGWPPATQGVGGDRRRREAGAGWRSASGGGARQPVAEDGGQWNTTASGGGRRLVSGNEGQWSAARGGRRWMVAGRQAAARTGRQVVVKDAGGSGGWGAAGVGWRQTAEDGSERRRTAKDTGGRRPTARGGRRWREAAIASGKGMAN
ncbi:uncharacterized protein LOC115665339 [Syzygium oleosum]|uniref:uncharacterized protein LOC115665339 n=1 Tax=Syzygium oleosum TaxID=219896 RepID=UPI0011D27A56|nr:uncharacterized protein LOC115665339 [Syzygium oleosum]